MVALILMNLLIAMMADTYETIKGQTTERFALARAQSILQMYHLLSDNVFLPTPTRPPHHTHIDGKWTMLLQEVKDDFQVPPVATLDSMQEALVALQLQVATLARQQQLAAQHSPQPPQQQPEAASGMPTLEEVINPSLGRERRSEGLRPMRPRDVSRQGKVWPCAHAQPPGPACSPELPRALSLPTRSTRSAAPTGPQRYRRMFSRRSSGKQLANDLSRATSSSEGSAQNVSAPSSSDLIDLPTEVDQQWEGPEALLPPDRAASRPFAALRGCEAGPSSSRAAAAPPPEEAAAALALRARRACPLPLQGEGCDTQRCFVVTAVRRASV